MSEKDRRRRVAEEIVDKIDDLCAVHAAAVRDDENSFVFHKDRAEILEKLVSLFEARGSVFPDEGER